MQLLIEIILMALLGILVYQDFCYRLISAIVVAFLFLLSSIYGMMQVGVISWMRNCSINLLLLSIEFLICWAVFMAFKGRKIQFADNYLGWGDILFLGIMACMFSTYNFIFILPLSLLTVAAVYTLIKLTGAFAGNKIPLAGALSLFMVGIKVYFILGHEYYYYDNVIVF